MAPSRTRHLAASGWPLLAARETTSFAQRLGLPDRAPLAPGAAARPTTTAVRAAAAALTQDFADTFGEPDLHIQESRICTCNLHPNVIKKLRAGGATIWPL